AAPLMPLRMRAVCSGSASGLGMGLGAPEQMAPGGCDQTSNCSLGRASPISVFLTRSLAGGSSVESATVAAVNDEVGYDAYVNVPLLPGAGYVGAGLVRMRTSLSAATSTACLTR